MIYKLLTKLGDKLGLVRDNKEPSITDGLKHILIQYYIQIGSSFGVWIIYKLITGVSNFEVVNISNYITTLIMVLVWYYSEYKQEKAMVDDGRHEPHQLKFKNWYHGRYQDIYIPTVFGLIYSGSFHIILRAIS